MNDDELLEEIGKAARAERDDDPGEQWDALAEGTLDAETVAELEALAAEDPDLGEALAAFTPLGDEAKDRFTGAILAELAPAPAATSEPAAPAEAKTGGAKIIPFPRRAATWLVPLAAAAAVAVLLLRPTTAPPFTAYQLDATAGERALRGSEPATAELPRYRDGSGLEIILRPQTRLDGTATVRAFLARGEAIDPWPAPVESAEGGAFRVSGVAGQLLPNVRGEIELLFAVGPAERRPATVEQVREALSEAPRGWTLLRYKLVRE